MKNLHTPAPWEMNRSSTGHFIQHQGIDIVHVEGVSQKAEANARLIAAAPELLAALQDLMSITKTQYSQMATYKLCKEIVSKATSHE